MTDPKKCKAHSDCPRPANSGTGRCDLHDALSMAADAMDLLEKTFESLIRIERRDREVETVERSRPVVPVVVAGYVDQKGLIVVCGEGVKRSTEVDHD
jgi:hypothetical protein